MFAHNQSKLKNTLELWSVQVLGMKIRKFTVPL